MKGTICAFSPDSGIRICLLPAEHKVQGFAHSFVWSEDWDDFIGIRTIVVKS